MMKRLKFGKLIAALCALAFTAGCAKDRTIEDYQNDKVARDRARMQAVKGEYRGTLVSKDGGIISAISIQVKDERQTSSPQGNGQPADRAVLEFTVTLTGVQPMSLTFNNGSYDHAAQYFRASSTVTGRGNATVSGVLEGDSLTGTLEAELHPERGGTFRVQRNAEAPQASVTAHARAFREGKFLFNSFSGMGTFRVGPPALVNMTIIRRASLPEQDMIDLLSPYRIVDVSVFFETVQEDGTIRRTGGTFPGAVWNIPSRTLSGVYNAPPNPNQPPTILHLTCDEVDGPSRQTGWNCQEHSAGVSPGEIFRATFMPSTTNGGTRE